MSISKLISGAVFSVIVLASFSVNAASYDSVHYISKYNSGGTSTKVLPIHSKHYCALSRVGVENTDTNREMARCNVRRAGAVWILEAWLERSSDADVQCGAVCFNY